MRVRTWDSGGSHSIAGEIYGEIDTINCDARDSKIILVKDGNVVVEIDALVYNVGIVEDGGFVHEE